MSGVCVVILVHALIGSAAFAKEKGAPPFGFLPCIAEPRTQTARSAELQKLLTADQADYRKQMEGHPEQPLNIGKLQKMAVKDLERRKRVGEILGEGCFESAADYAAASLIFQHGNTPDHFFQAFLWAQKAVSLGDTKSKNLVALTVDRFLVKSGMRQLFGTQLEKAEGQSCLCLDPVEDSFPDSKRVEYLGRNLKDQIAFLADKSGNHLCMPRDCAVKLNHSPAGTVLGFW